MVLVSNLADKTRVHYVQVKLTGTRSNRDGLGAIVKVTAGGTTYTKVMDGNSGYLSHSVYPLYFGLGAAERVDRIEVRVAVRGKADRRRAEDEFGRRGARTSGTVRQPSGAR